MTNRQRRAGAVLAAFAAAVAAWLPASSAQAADGPVVHISVQSDDIGIPVPAGDAPQISWGLFNDGPGTAKDVTVKADFSKVKDWVTADGKSVDTYTWSTIASVPEGSGSGYIVDLAAKPGTPLGTKGTVTLSGTSSNGTVVSKTVEVTVGNVELTVNKLTDRKGDKPGSTIENPVTISNTGSLPAHGAQLRMRTTVGLSYADRYSNCVYSTSDDVTYQATQQALCTFDTVLEPGKRYRLQQPVRLDVTDQALFEYFRDDVLPSPGDPTAMSSGDHKLSLVEDGTATPGGSETGRQVITVDNTADMVAGGDKAEGAPGDVVHVDVSLSNEGPGWVSYNLSDDQPALLFTVPTGTKAVEIPKECSVWNEYGDGGTGEQTPGAPRYVCDPHDNTYAVGDSRTFRFGLEIRKGAKTTTGEVKAMTAYGNVMTFDDNHTNDTAAVTVEVEGDDSGTGASPSASATPSGGDDGNAPTTQTVDDTAATGSLASTGSSSVLPVAAAVGAGALLVGGGLVFVVRRRRA
ncbi:LPXTG cell wall anchor domain-containing protein [Streptomyces griseorubiginosus]|uniref:LPXTG cell wall anchor domain-containing protein n=1 Tax=Streptomyces griseorubiginosus TaxID=67304 RepID=UPI001AD7544A|nr:LPXTG cell wall anchor domain-containing protein [Streptomyces griseorubiginosus]MBO4258837.1 LPXTG cell wall anchor domain-containing protein [Streptomyces griseorubiginosus]